MQPGNGNAFKIANMREHIRIYKSYNVSEFQQFTINKSQLQEAPPPMTVTMSGDAEYGLEALREWQVEKAKSEF
jgi:hypothetical protein